VRKIVGGAFVAVAIVALGACSGGSSSSGGSTSDFCNTLKVDKAAFDSIQNDPSNAQFQAAFNDLAGKAPSEIKADMQALLKGIKDSQSALSALSADPSKADSIESQFSSEETTLKASADHITAFAKSKCGVDLESSSSS
jgi:hypothetical protein